LGGLASAEGLWLLWLATLASPESVWLLRLATLASPESVWLLRLAPLASPGVRLLRLASVACLWVDGLSGLLVVTPS